jgi:uncharacterized protein
VTSPRIVLDTNVCLDLFVFDDPRCASLGEALLGARVVAVTDDACRNEWLRVLRYPQLQLDEIACAAATRRFDAVVRHCSLLGSFGAEAIVPPRCRDPDDQKFLELAVRVQARWLLTRDDHLLALARRARREGLFEILTPSAWIAGEATR